MVGSGEVDLHAGELLDLAVPMKLRSVISGDGFEEVGVTIDELEEPLVESVDGVAAQLADENAAGRSLDESHDAMFGAGSCYCIDLPVADLLAVFNGSRPL